MRSLNAYHIQLLIPVISAGKEVLQLVELSVFCRFGQAFAFPVNVISAVHSV